MIEKVNVAALSHKHGSEANQRICAGRMIQKAKFKPRLEDRLESLIVIGGLQETLLSRAKFDEHCEYDSARKWKEGVNSTEQL